MSILQNDIMTIDQASADLEVVYVNIDTMMRFVLGLESTQKHIQRELDALPIMDLNSESIRSICDKVVLGGAQKFNIDTDGRSWFYWRKETKYTRKFGILIKPRHISGKDYQDLVLDKGEHLWDS